MDIEPISDREQLVKELMKVAQRGLGRSLPGRQSEETIPRLSEISRVLAKDSAEDWPLRIGRVVLKEVERFEPPDDKLAIADVLAIDLEQPIEESVRETAGPLWSKGETEGRYARAANLYNLSEKEFADNKRLELLGRLAKRLLEKAENRSEVQPTPGETVEDDPAEEPALDTPLSPRLLVGAVGVLLILIGAGWLIATITGSTG